MKLAVVDIGTNSIHMILVRVDADLSLHVIDRAKEMVHLGEGTFESGRLDEYRQRAGLEALSHFVRLAERRGVTEFVAVATSAVREAENGGAFLQDVYHETGVHPRIITGEEEAHLIYKAVQRALPLGTACTLVADLGGGSLEVACGTENHVKWATSRPVGVRRLLPVALDGDTVTKESHEALRARVEKDASRWLKRARDAAVEQCVVTSGSAQAVLKLLRARGTAPAGERLMPAKALAELDDALVGTTREDRLALPGMDKARADLIVPAVAFFRALADGTGVGTLRVGDVALREGLVYDWMDRHAEAVQWELTEPNERRRTVLRFGERFHYHAGHAHQVARLAVQLFDATRGLHHLPEDARELLEYGALLHDVGYVLNDKKHHKHAEYMILSGLSGGFTSKEVRIIACIARYHRKAHPKSRHSTFAELDAASQELVRKTAGILRIADGLDRSHARVVRNVTGAGEDGAFTIVLDADAPPELEIWAARRKAHLFEDAFGLTVAFRLGAAFTELDGPEVASDTVAMDDGGDA